MRYPLPNLTEQPQVITRMDALIAERLEVVTADITTLSVDAIVNAANESLLGGGGVDGAIHRAAGPRLLEHTRTLGGCPTGLARITPAFDLEKRGVRWIIHTVGPRWQEPGPIPGASLDEEGRPKAGSLHADILLASCIHQCLELAAAHNCQSLALPSISTGAFGFPPKRAARITIGHVLSFLADRDLPGKIIFCTFTDDDAATYRQVLQSRNQWMFNRRRG